MIWVTWRRYRTTLVVATTVIALLAVATFACGSIVRNAEGARAFGTFFGCYGTSVTVCRAESALSATAVLAAVLPVLLGVIVGVTAFSRDIEQGTHVLGLTQSVSRSRWFWMRVLVVFVPISVAMAVLGAVLEWTRSAAPRGNFGYVSGSPFDYSRLEFPLFPASGATAGTYTLFALILGSAFALVIRHTVGAMVLTLIVATAGMVGLQVGARPHYAPASIEARPLDGSAQYVAYASSGASFPGWTIGSGYVNTAGDPVAVDYASCEQAYAVDYVEGRPDETVAEYEARSDELFEEQQRAFTDCLRGQGADHLEVRYHADSQFRRFQLTEAALVLLVTGLVLLPSLWGLRRLRP
ncbi:ABC transporter permease [Rhodococcus spelaei]|uniref:ABC transporter permease n=1 Tax=Rhodococcus spelaei TaxID=2546320 RepID=A0A541BAL4_9NOCA|nr:ABC transporter permease [Rhodococcus spelaei]TQF69382.1 ABC transporter permease [Rhodococcus spelaei]